MTFAEQEFRERRRANPLKAPAPVRGEAEPATAGTYPCTPTGPLGMTFVADRAQIKDWNGRVIMDSGEPGKAVEHDCAPGADVDSGRHYRYSYRGIKLDPYRIIHIYRITHPSHQHALKKLLRAGKSVKSLRQDIKEVQDALTRWLEMLDEDEAHGD